MQSHNPLAPPFAAHQDLPLAHGRHPKVVPLYSDFPLQHYSVLRCARRYIVLVAGRRWGKTWLALWKMLCHAASRPQQLCLYIAPTLKQAKEIAWQPLIDLAPPQVVKRIRLSALELQLNNNSVIRLCGPSHLRGSGIDYAVVDEFAHFEQPQVWAEVILPMLADREGHALICSTPFGLNHFYDLYGQVQTMPNWATFLFPTSDGGYVSDRELQGLRSIMDPKLYAQEFEARFEPSQSRVYHTFSREANVRVVEQDNYLPLLAGLDFNVGQMSAVLAQNGRDECRVFDEIILHNSDTHEMMQELTRRQPKPGIVHPDPTCFARKTSAEAGVTDCSIIEKFHWYVHRTNPYPVVNRINAVNAMLRNANGHRRLIIDPKCKYLIRSLEGLTYKEGTRMPDKSHGLDHAGDALGYLIAAIFPGFDSNNWSKRDAYSGKDLTD